MWYAAQRYHQLCTPWFLAPYYWRFIPKKSYVWTKLEARKANKPVAIAIQKSFEYWSIVASRASRDFWRCITGASFQKYSCVQIKHQAMRTNKPVAIAIKKSFEYWSVVVGNVCRDFRRRITGASFQKYTCVHTKHQAMRTDKPMAIAIQNRLSIDL